jgi:integrase
MTIYPERSKQGAPTGVWIIEIRKMTNGVSKTIRRRSRDHSEALRLESELRGIPEGAAPTRERPIFQLATTRAKELPKPASNADWRQYAGVEGFSLTDVRTPEKVFTSRDLFEGAKAIHRGAKDEKQSCKRLQDALEIIGWDLDVREVRTPALDFLSETLRARGLNPKTINRYLFAVSGALRWAHERELILGMPHIPRQDEGVGRLHFLSVEDQERILKWLMDHDLSDVAFCTRALILTGLRISEFMHLKRADIKDGWVKLHQGMTKNDQPRSVYVDELGTELIAMLKSGLPHYRKINRGLAVASTALNIEPHVTCHTLRHTAATRLTTAGISLATVARMLGHQSLSTTMRYAHSEDEALIAASKVLRSSG